MRGLVGLLAALDLLHVRVALRHALLVSRVDELDVAVGRVDIREALAGKERVGTGTHADVRLRVPVHEVVAAFAAGERPVRDLVMLITRRGEALTRPLVLVCYDV